MAACGHVKEKPTPPPAYSLDFGMTVEALRRDTLAAQIAYALYDVDSYRTQPLRTAPDIFNIDFSGIDAGMAYGLRQIVMAGYTGPVERDDCDTSGDWVWNNPLDRTNDYRNSACAPDTVPLALQLQAARPLALTPERRAALETRLTAWAERVRTELAAIALQDGGAGSVAAGAVFVPVSIRIGGSGLNVTAKKGVRVIEISPDVLRELFARAVFRATRVYANGGGFGSVFGMQVSGDTEGVSRSTPPGLQRYFAILSNLSGFYHPYLPANDVVGWLDRVEPHFPDEMRAGFRDLRDKLDCAADEPDPGLVYETDGSCQGGVGDAISVLMDEDDFGDGLLGLRETQKLLAAHMPEPARDAAFDSYLTRFESMVRLGEEDEDNLEGMQTYFAYLTEVSQVTNAVTMELQKSLLFLMSHELYHVWVDDMPLKTTELAADVFATRTYTSLFPEMIEALFKSEGMLNDEAQIAIGDFDTDTRMLEYFGGRPPDAVFADIYRDTEYFEGDVSHPPFPERLAQIRRLIDEQGLELSAEMTRSLTCMTEAQDDAARTACPQLVYGGNL